MLIGAHLITSNAFGLSLASQPLGAFIIGLVVHHLGDALPHLDSNIFQFEDNGNSSLKTLATGPLKFWLFFLLDLAIGIIFLTYLLQAFTATPDKRLLVFWASFGALLPDILNFFFRGPVMRTKLGQAYLGFHKHFHFRFKATARLGQILSAMLVELLFIGFSLLLIWGLV